MLDVVANLSRSLDKERPLGSKRTSILLRYGAPTRVLATALAIATLAILQSANAQVNAETWPRLSDGRAVIEVKGFKVALPSQGGDLDMIAFPDENDPVKKRMTLRQVVDAPNIAKQTFAQANYVSISLPNLPERGGLYLNKFRRSDFRTYNANLSIGAKAANICKDHERQHDAFLESYNKQKEARNGRLEIKMGDLILHVEASATANGWLRFKYADGNSLFLRAHDSNAVSQSPKFTGLSCGAMCRSTICVGQEASFSFIFNPDAYPEPEWLALLERVNDVIRYITEF